MSTDLIKYNAAKKALAAAHDFDEVKDIRDKAVAIRLYALQAKDRVLIDQATEIRLRAERRAGELLIEMEKNKGAAAGGKKDAPRGRIVQPRDSKPKLADLGINKTQSSRWQKLASAPEDAFEEVVTQAQQKACASIDRARQPKRAAKPKQRAGNEMVPAWTVCKTMMVPCDRITIKDRLIPPTSEQVDEMAKSLDSPAGQINRILVRRWGANGYRVVCGAVRLEAARKLGWPEIYATLVSAPDDRTYQVLEREENLDRCKHEPSRQSLRDAGAARRDVTAPAMASHSERGFDCYETPPEAVRALLEVERFPGPIWECACGPGAIVNVLRETGHTVVATDLVNYHYPDATGGVDFLTQRQAPAGVTAVVTNPPYRHANAFVRHARTLVPRVVMLLPLRFLEGQGRSDILDGGRLARVHVFRNRLPRMHRDGWQGPKSSSAVAFAWFVWDAAHEGTATLNRITWTSPPVVDSGIPPFLRRAT